jgi:hypothetical protein
LRHHSLAIAIAVLVLGAANVSAQVIPDSALNRRVRVYLVQQNPAVEGKVEPQMLRGTLTRNLADSVTLAFHNGATPVRIAATAIQQVDLSQGVSPERTALRRGLAAAATWFVIGVQSPLELGGGPVENAFLWTSGAFVVGAVLGFIFPEEQWKRVFQRE